MDTKMGVMQPQGEEGWQPQKLDGESGTMSPQGSGRSTVLATPWFWTFWPVVIPGARQQLRSRSRGSVNSGLTPGRLS